MKRFKILIFISCILQSFLNHAQLIVIDVFEHQSYFSDTVYSMHEALFEGKSYSTSLKSRNDRYIIDRKNLTSSFYHDNQLKNVENIELTTHDGLTFIKILSPGFNYGLILNLDSKNESVVWYWRVKDEQIQYKLFTKFQIVKSN